MTSMYDDPRFATAIALFNAGDWLEASDAFEELYFEAVLGEIEMVRVMLQFSTGLHHTSRGQRRPAVERIEEGLKAAGHVKERHGIDLQRLCNDMRSAVDAIQSGGKPGTIVVHRLAD